jgi:hypothetical protein
MQPSSKHGNSFFQNTTFLIQNKEAGDPSVLRTRHQRSIGGGRNRLVCSALYKDLSQFSFKAVNKIYLAPHWNNRFC